MACAACRMEREQDRELREKERDQQVGGREIKIDKVDTEGGIVTEN